MYCNKLVFKPEFTLKQIIILQIRVYLDCNGHAFGLIQ